MCILFPMHIILTNKQMWLIYNEKRLIQANSQTKIIWNYTGETTDTVKQVFKVLFVHFHLGPGPRAVCTTG